MSKIEATQFKDQQPGLTWIKLFMKRNKLSHKKAEMISSARKSNTANTFITYDFLDQLEEVGDDSNSTLTDYLQISLLILLSCLIYASILFY